MGAMELQIFVSLVVVLGAAFVALICDFLKGSNERLREANLELRVRQDQQQVQPAVSRREAPVPMAQVESTAAAQALAKRVVGAAVTPERQAVVAREEEVAEPVVAGGRRRGRQSQQEQRAAQMEAWAQELVQRKIAAPVVAAAAAAASAAVVEDLAPETPGLATLPAGGALTRGIGISAAPGALQPHLPAAEPPVATAEALQGMRGLRMSETLEPVMALPLPGRAVQAGGAEPIPAEAPQVDPAMRGGEWQAGGVTIGEAGLVAGAPVLPLAVRASIRTWPVLAEQWAESAVLIPVSKLELEGGLPQVAEAEAPVEEEQEPVVRIRVLREEPAEELAAPGPLELPMEEAVAPLETKRESEPLAGEPAFAAEPVLPRENRRNVVELPISVPSSAEIPAGWHGVERLKQLAGAPGAFEGLTVAVGVNEYERLVAQYGESRCQEALAGLASSLEALAADNDFLCQNGEEEFVLLFPGLGSSEQPAKLRLLAEVLWDFQLRTLSSVPMLCAWGAAEGLREPLSAVLGRAREQMQENRRVKRGGASLLSRFRRRVVNA